MPKSSKKILSADEVAAKASRGEDISAYFSNKFSVVRPVRRMNQEAAASSAKTKLTPAKMPLPKFASDQEAVEFFESHSVAGIWDQFPEVQPGKPTRALVKKIVERHAGSKISRTPRQAT